MNEAILLVFAPIRLAGILSIAAASALMAGGAHAQSAFSPTPPLMTWEGFYGGSLIGGGFSSTRLRQTDSKTVSLSGLTGGSLLGYNWQAGRFVYGIEGDVTLHLIRGDTSGSAGLVPTHVDSLYSAHVRGHLGYDLGSFQPFVTAGAAMNESYESQLGALAAFGDNHTQYGWTVGAGLDWRLSAPVIGPFVLRAEYLYEAFPERTFDLGGALVRSRFDTSYVRAAFIYVPGASASPPPSAEPAFVDWSGGYAGLIGGGNWLRPTTSGSAGSRSFDVAGPAGGIYVGRNFMFGRWVVGLDGTTELADVSGNGAFPGVASPTRFRQNIEVDARGRLGYAIGRFLPFVAAGATFTRSVQSDPATGSQRGRIPADSPTVGAGVDYRLSDRWSVRGEYLYSTTYRKKAVPLDGCDCAQSLDAQTVRFGVAYQFE